MDNYVIIADLWLFIIIWNINEIKRHIDFVRNTIMYAIFSSYKKIEDWLLLHYSQISLTQKMCIYAMLYIGSPKRYV